MGVRRGRRGYDEAGVLFQHLCDTLMASPGLFQVFSLAF